MNIDVVANHKGFFYFQLCPHNDPDSAATRECFEDNRLKYEDGADVWYIPQVRFIVPVLRHSYSVIVMQVDQFVRGLYVHYV